METSSSRLRLLTAIANMKQRCSSIPGIIDASDPRVTPRPPPLDVHEFAGPDTDNALPPRN